MDLHIRDILKEFIKQDKLNDGIYLKKIEQYWHNHLSPMISDRTRNIKFSKGKLMLYIDSAPLRNEMINNKDLIISKINDHFQEAIVQSIEIY